MNGGRNSCSYIASFTPTYLTHSPTAFTLLSQIHRESNDSWAKSGISWLHVACMQRAQGHYFSSFQQKQGQRCNFLGMTWHSHSTVQLSLHLCADQHFTQIGLSFHTRPLACMDPNGVLLWLPPSPTVAPLDPNEALWFSIRIKCNIPLHLEEPLIFILFYWALSAQKDYLGPMVV